MKIRLKKEYAIILLVLAGISLFALVVGGSYAFFTHQVTSKDYVVYTGNLQIDYTKTGSLINLTNTYPKTNTDGLQEAGYSFNITNNGNIDARYQIRLELDTNNTIPIEYIKLAYVKEKENNVTTNNSYIEPVLLSNLNNTLTFVTNQQLEASKMDSYTLKMWIDYNAPNDIQGKTFKATIVIDSLQDVEDGYVMTGTRPIITLNKTTTGETDMHLLQNTDPNAAFTDPGVLSVKDDKDLLTQADVRISYQYTSDGENLSTVNGIDLATTGVYYINYEVTDSDNLTGTAVRVVTVNNTPAIPTITLNGASPMTLTEKQVFDDPGVTVAQGNHVAVIGEVKTSQLGSYTVRYIVIDANGNLNSVTRTVIVNEKTVWDFEFDPDNDGEGQVQTFTASKSGNYKLEVWGAQGGSYDSNYHGGYGGYSVGTIEISNAANNQLFIYVGGAGDFTVGTTPGGFNGGGDSTPDTTYYTGSGGGATHIALDSGLLSILSSHATDGRILIVAGGGGGTAQDITGTYSGIGGSGGGYIGNDGTSTYGNPVGGGGTQTTGGTGGFSDGTFGTGANASNAVNSQRGGAGGGGYYGGGSGISFGAAGGGGSGYIASSKLASVDNIRKSMYCYNCQEALNTETDSSIFTVSTTGTSSYRDTTNCPNGYSSDPVAKCAKAGNGHARITYLGN